MIILNATRKQPTFVDPAAIVTCRRSMGSTLVRTRDGELFDADETPEQVARLRAAWRGRPEHTDAEIIAIKLVSDVLVATYADTGLEAAR
jgi:hypothetical protein